MAWMDENGVVHLNWVYEPKRLVGPLLARSIDAAPLAELRLAAEALGEIMVYLVDQLGSDLDRDEETENASFVDLDVPEDLIVDTSEPKESLSVQLSVVIDQVPIRWKAEVVQAINEIVHDRIDEIDRGESGEIALRDLP